MRDFVFSHGLLEFVNTNRFIKVLGANGLRMLHSLSFPHSNFSDTGMEYAASFKGSAAS